MALDINKHRVTDSNWVKVLLQADDKIETLWAVRVGPDRFRLDNSPFWAYGLSSGDVVEARLSADGALAFERVHEKSGHRTVRVVLDPPADRAPASQAVLDGLVAIGATYEGMHPGYLAIDVPPTVALEQVVAFLVASGHQWEHADPPYDELYPNG